MNEETRASQDAPSAEVHQVAERSLVGLLASDTNTVALAAAATAASTAAGMLVKNAMDRHGQGAGDKGGPGEGDGDTPR